MRKLVTIAATALTLSVLSLATPALADHTGNGGANGNNSNGQYQNNQNDNDDGDRGRGRRYDGDRNFDRHEGRFRGWEQGWRQGGDQHYGQHHPLPYWKLMRRIERQGYFGVRGLRPSQWGYGWRAFAFYAIDGHPVMLRIDPYTGRVLAARHL